MGAIAVVSMSVLLAAESGATDASQPVLQVPLVEADRVPASMLTLPAAATPIESGSAPAVGLPPGTAAPGARSATIEQALRSPPDPYGIPSGLYAVDAQLLSFRQAIESRTEGRRTTGKQMIGGGAALLLVSGLLFIVAANNASEAEQARASGSIVINDPSGMQYAVGAANALVGLVCVGYGASLVGTKPDPEFLQAYCLDTYRPRR